MRGEESPLVRFGMVADIHYADRDSFGPCHFRESLGRLDEAVAVKGWQRAASCARLRVDVKF